MSMSAGPRDAKVRATSTDSKQATPKSVVSMNEMRMFALEVGDENGVRQQVVAFRLNGVWYHDALGKSWLERLKPIAADGWLSKTLEERLNASGEKAIVPSSDSVDIMGGG